MGCPSRSRPRRDWGFRVSPKSRLSASRSSTRLAATRFFTYKKDWEALSERIGYWLDYVQPYATLDVDYVESVWWILKQLADRGLLYRGYKNVPYCPRCGTGLSSHEVALGYRDIEDSSLHFLCPWLTNEGEPDPKGRAFLVWTTTPWTVPSNAGPGCASGSHVCGRPDTRDGVWYWPRSASRTVLAEGVEVLRSVPKGSELAGHSLRPAARGRPRA